jgi:hypothetical protein
MKSKVMLPLALVLSGVILSPTISRAQPGGGFTHRSLETRIVQSPVVFRGTITNVTENLTQTSDQDGAHPLFNYTVILQINEVFKGNLPRQPFKFSIHGVGKWPELEKWAAERVSCLWFLHDTDKSMGADFHALENVILLGPSLDSESAVNSFPMVYDKDMTVLSRPETILARARAFAKKRMDSARFHSIYLPEQSSSDHLFIRSYLTVPVEPSLEHTAKHLIAAPEDFISAKSDSVLVPQWRCDLRAEGVRALQYFKSAKNIRLLRSYLDAPDSWTIRDWSTRNRDANMTAKTYSVRSEAYEVLKGWGVDVPKPVREETIPAKETKP